MADEKTAPKWRDDEKIALLLMLLEKKGDWKAIALPPDRTMKACTNVLSRMKEEARKVPWYNAGVAQEGKGGTGATKSKKRIADGEDKPAKKARVKKEKNTSGKAENEED